MARIPYFDNENATDHERQLLDKLPQLNVFKMIGHLGAGVNGFISLGAALLMKGKLDPIHREMAIVRTGIMCGSDYEVHQHKRISRDVGMSEEKIDALKAGSSSPVFTDLEKTVLRFTEEVVANVKSSNETFNELSKYFSNEMLVELVITIGYYMMASRFLENFEVDIEG